VYSQATVNFGGEISGDPFALLRSNGANAMQRLLRYKVKVYRYFGKISRQSKEPGLDGINSSCSMLG
jgi:hypothetical protein